MTLGQRLRKRALLAAVVLGAFVAGPGIAQAGNWDCRKGREDPSRFEAHSFTFAEDVVEISTMQRSKLEQLAMASRSLNVICVVGVVSDDSDEKNHENLMVRRAQAVAQVMIENGAMDNAIIVENSETKFAEGRFNKYFDKSKKSGPPTSLVEVLFMR